MVVYLVVVVFDFFFLVMRVVNQRLAECIQSDDVDNSFLQHVHLFYFLGHSTNRRRRRRMLMPSSSANLNYLNWTSFLQWQHQESCCFSEDAQ